MSVPKTFLLAEPFWLRKIITDPHILTDVNTVRPDDRYPKLKICISELILVSIPSSRPVIQLACNFAVCAMRYQMQPLSLADYMLHRPRSSWLHKTFPWETNDPWLEFRHGQKSFLSSQMSRPNLGHIQPPIEWVQGFFSGGKRPGREVYHLPPFSVQVKHK